MRNQAQLQNYQDSGSAASCNDASHAMQFALAQIPDEVRHLYGHKIRYMYDENGAFYFWIVYLRD